jgi:transposase InsO family protein
LEFVTWEWVEWFNHRRLLVPVGNTSLAEAKTLNYAGVERLGC